MAVGLDPPDALAPIDGVRVAAVSAGIRNTGRRDLVLIEWAEGAEVAAVFTRNRYQAAPVVVARRYLSVARPRALVINSGNANAGTGAPGVEDARAVTAAVACGLGIKPEQVLPFSTGVIGQRLPLAAMTAAIPAAVSGLTRQAWNDAAEAIMTTDTVAKGASVRFELAGAPVTMTGIAKGAGMIHPDMATMLAFIATDARVPREVLQSALQQACDVSFNRITVDGDTSTNDACVLVATANARQAIIERAEGDDYYAFLAALSDLASRLAQAIVRDGEGATKFVTVRVSGAKNQTDARAVALTVALSPLVKTALFASDANWGRILAAVGRAPASEIEIATTSLRINGVSVLAGGEPDTAYSEQAGQAAMAETDIELMIDLGRGEAEDCVWTSDLSHEYVRINAEYRT